MEEDKSCKEQERINRKQEMPAEERLKYLSPEMIYDERELEFFKTRDEVRTRSIAHSKESSARTREFMTRIDESIARDQAYIDKLIAEQNNNT